MRYSEVAQRFQVNDRVQFNGSEFLVAEAGEDGSLALTPVMMSGPSSSQPGDVELPSNHGVKLIARY